MARPDLERRLENLFSPPPDAGAHGPTAPATAAPRPPESDPRRLPAAAPDESVALNGQGISPGSAASSHNGASGRSYADVADLPQAPLAAPDLASESRFLRTIVDQIPEPVFVKDRARRWVIVNAAYCELAGRSETELLSQVDSAVETGAWSLEEAVFETGQAYAVEESMVSPDGRTRTCSIDRRLIEDPFGQPYLLGVVRDISGLRQVESALHESESRWQAEREQWEAARRRLKRALLIQLGIFATVIAAAAGIYLVLRMSGEQGRVFANEPEPTAAPATAAAIQVTPTSDPPTATPTATSTPTPAPSATPTLARPAATIAPTLAPRAIYSGTELMGAPPDPAPLREFGPNVINVLLLGSDRRPGDQAWRTDVVILASIDTGAPSLTLLSFPRDLWVYVPGWHWQRINLADGHGEASGFPGGGPGLLKQTIQYNFGIPVQYYARVDFSGYKKLVDAVDGIDVVADCPLYDIFPDVPDGQTDIISGEALATVPTGTIDIPMAGVYHLDGKHALWYARSRKTTSDFDRSRRQQRVLRGLWDAIQQQALVPQLPQLWDALTQAVETDLGFNDVIYLADVGSRVSPAHTRSRFVDGSMLTWHVTESGANVLLYDFDEIAPYLDEWFAPLPRNIASQAPAWVDVQNGTSHPDWERVAADRLSWEGYNVYAWSRSASPHAQTTLVDYTSNAKGSRLDALAALFAVAPENIVHQPDPDSPFSYRVIVGDDWEPCQRPAWGRPSAPPPTPVATPEGTPAP